MIKFNGEKFTDKEFDEAIEALRDVSPLLATALEGAIEYVDDDRLKPCPFCGGKAVVDIEDFHAWHVKCMNCLAQIPWMERRRQAVEAWNRRVECAGGKEDSDNADTGTNS